MANNRQGPKYKLIRGVEKAYTNDEGKVWEEYLDAVYFAIDSQKIFLGGVCVGKGKDEKIVKEVRIDRQENGDYVLVVRYTDDDLFTFNFSSLLLYSSKLPDDTVVPEKIGNIPAGTKVSELKERSVSEILDDVLFPELQPSVTEPKAIISFASESLRSGYIFEVGAAAPQEFNTRFFKGVASVVGLQKQSRSGELIEDSLTGIVCNGSVSLPAEISLGDMEYCYQAHYDKGPEILTSKGIPSTVITPNPLPEGIVKSQPLVLKGSYPYISNGIEASPEYQELSLPVNFISDSKLPLKDWKTKVIGVMFASEAYNDQRITFRFQEGKQLLKVEYFNTIGGAWNIFNPENYEVTPDHSEKIIQGHRVNYKVFTTKGNLLGAIQLRFTLEDV